ncbi:hypothetical protein QTN24_15555 [Cupriavidus sp. SZY C1]|uniref:STY1053 family phage-associated protein n=1 Tax=Cupriavidus sp. SZY C1 TaxID=3055037 RepID=UPI0028BAD452|nr:hypothetical protein [Cupriavidus sp. SZY C1]MDT6962916.1 hypothetical protein [Cupriavidus sp. SZY C1]
MAKNHVHTAFSLTEDNGNVRKFVAGEEVPRELVDHWYVKLHTGEAPTVDPGAEAAADELLAELEAKAKALDEREKALQDSQGILGSIREEQNAKALALSEREKAADQREADLNARAEVLDGREVAIANREKAAEAAGKDANQQGRRQGK